MLLHIKAIKASHIRLGQWFGIFGVDGLGNLAVLYAKHVLGAKLVACDISEDKLAFAKETFIKKLDNTLAELH